MENKKILKLSEKIFDYLSMDDKVKSVEDIIKNLKIKKVTDDFYASIKYLKEAYLIMENKKGMLGTLASFGFLKGVFHLSKKNFGFVIPLDKDTKDKKDDLYIPYNKIGKAMHNDIVLAKIEKAKNDIGKEGEIVDIIERANKKIVGTYTNVNRFSFVEPDDPKIKKQIYIKKDKHKILTGSKVVVEITKWHKNDENPEGKVIEVLGHRKDVGVDILSIMRKFDLREEFPKEVMDETLKISDTVLKKDLKKRVDRRNLPIITIDGEDAKDLDDGVYAEKLPDGNYFLGVYIADVSHYVKENSPLDVEAFHRGNSVYLVDRVVPMLPKKLSNGICSLNEKVDRLSFACEMIISKSGKVIKYDILPVVIKVYRRMTYSIVNKILVDKDKKFIEDNRDILPLLENLKAVYKVLKKRRRKLGCIDFDLTEIKFKLDNKGKPVDVIKRVQNLGEKIIEDCMLCANETVAKHMFHKNLPFIYRIHENPKGEKIDDLNKLLNKFSMQILPDKKGEIPPKSLQAVLNKVKDLKEANMISKVALRCMQQAKYSKENMGHYGLAFSHYTHFTSPIRRYSDLIVHRLLKLEIEKKYTKLKERKYNKKLEDIALHTSKTERVAIEAERETLALKSAEFMEQFIGEEFTGIINGVTGFGLFVEMEMGIEGMVPIASLVNDYYEYLPDEFSLVGRKYGFSYKLGDSVNIIVSNVKIEDRTIELFIKNNSPRVKKYANLIANFYIFDENNLVDNEKVRLLGQALDKKKKKKGKDKFLNKQKAKKQKSRKKMLKERRQAKKKMGFSKRK